MIIKLILTFSFFLIFTINIKADQLSKMKNTGSDSSEFIMNKFKDGIDFYAMGNEPFWNMNLAVNQFLHFNELNGISINLGSVQSEKAMDANVTRYTANTDYGFFTMTLSEQECFDNMSGDTFTYRVIIEINNPGDKGYKKFDGCGKYVPDFKLNRTWILKKTGDKDVTESDYQNGLPQITFDIGKNRFSGSGGCNRIMGNVKSEYGYLRFSKVASTMMACPNLDLEKEFISAMDNTINYKILGNELILANPDKQLMVLYDPTLELKEKSGEEESGMYRLNDIWVLETINETPADVKNYMRGLPGIEINISEKTFSGNGGCNQISGTFKADNETITFGPVASTRMACPGNFESEFITGLGNTNSYKIENNRLYLFQDGKTVLVFRKID